MVEPVRLNPNKLDMNSFNTMFEQTRIPDPEESGYGDWLKGGEEGGTGGPQLKFSGKFNREVFHRAFEEEHKGKNKGSSDQPSAIIAQEQTLAGRYATEIGRSAREDYTMAANDGGMKYTDLKKAYTEYNTFSQNTAGVKVENRTLDAYSKQREKAPAPLADHEMAALLASERAAKEAEERRKVRMAEESIAEGNYFERMKQLVIRN
jgi:hypothetical protein